jgi:hypothetical protein
LIADSEFERSCKEVRAWIKKSGTKGRARYEFRDCRALLKVDDREQDRILTTLRSQEYVRLVSFRAPTNGGKERGARHVAVGWEQ